MRQGEPGSGAFVLGSEQSGGQMTRDEVEALFARRQEDYERLDAAALAADYSDTCVVETPWAGAR